MEVKDCNGNLLSEGDTIVVMKTLKVKGSSMELKKGTVIKRIHLIEDEDDAIECKVEGSKIVLITEFLKKG